MLEERLVKVEWLAAQAPRPRGSANFEERAQNGHARYEIAHNAANRLRAGYALCAYSCGNTKLEL